MSTFWLSNPCSSFDFFYNTVFIGTLALLGIAANLLSIVVLYLDRHNRVATFLLRSLAVADISVLVTVFVVLSFFFGTHSVPGFYVQHTRYAIPYLKKYVNPLGYMAQCSTIWLTVLIAVNRYVAICHPFKADRFLTIRTARIQVAVVYVLAVLLNVPRIFQYNVIYTRQGNDTVPHKHLTAMGASSGYDIFYLNVFHTAVLFILPLVVLVIINFIIIRELQVAKANMQSRSLHYIGSQEKNITNIIIIIIMVVILCHTPDRVLTVFKAIQKPENKHCPDPLIYASHLCNLLIVVTSSANFVIYCIFRQRFRRILWSVVCRPCAGDDWRRELTMSPTSPEQSSLRSWPGSIHRSQRRSTARDDHDHHAGMNGRAAASNSASKRASSQARKPASDASMRNAKDDEAIVTFHIGP